MPEWRDEIRRRLAMANLRPEREAEIVDEITQHLDDRYRDNVAAGTLSDEAEAVAWRELDAGDLLGREVAHVEHPVLALPPPGAPSRGSFLAALWQDTRYALRRLRARPFFAFIAIATVALSVGPATAIFGVADALFFRQPAGIQAPDRLIKIQFGRPSPRGGFYPWFVSYANVADVSVGAKNFTDMTGLQPVSAGLSAKGSDPRHVDGQSVNANFFRLLGVRLVAGRGFFEEEDATPGGVTSVVIAEPLARDLFGSAQAAMNQTVQLNSVPFTVVGVSDPLFEGTESAADPSRFWITGQAYHRVRHFAPDRWAYDTNRGPFYTYLVRLASGVSVANAEEELRGRIAGLATAGRPGADLFKTINMRVLPGFGAPRSLNTTGVEIVRQLAVVAAVLVVLGIANMANLLMFHGVKLNREVAIRKALGASVARLVQQTLVESLLLSVTGAVAGIGVALAIQAVLADVSVWGIGTVTVPLDWRVLGATIALAVVTGISFGVGPALMAGRGPLLAAIGRGLRTEWPRAGKLRQGLAAVQLALSLVLLVGALLFLMTLKHLHDVDLGFDASNVTTLQLDLGSHGYDKPRMFAFYAHLIDLVKRAPGIDSAAIAFGLPLFGGSYSSSLYLPGGDPKSAPEVLINLVSSGYFDVLHIPVRGRAFTPEESFATSRPSTIVLSGTAARVLFGDADPLGQIVVAPEKPSREYTVVGVTTESRWRDVTQPPDAVAYEPFYDGLATVGASIMARSSRPSHDVARVIQSAAASLDPATPLFGEQTMSAVIGKQVARQRLFAWVLGLLGGIGFFLAAIGVHGLASQMVAERSREFGIRIAVGADRRAIVRLVLRQAAVVATVGAVVGLGVAAFAGRLIAASLFGVTTRDPFVYASATALLVAVVLVAAIGPTRSATRIDPMSVLRME